MAINLKKGQSVALDKGMVAAIVALGWDINKYDGGSDFDLDTSCFLVGENGKVNREEDFIFYSNLKSRGDAVVHTGDNRTGVGDGDDEVIRVNFKKMPEDIKKIVVCVTIHEAESRRQNFGQVSGAYVRLDKIVNDTDTSGETVLKFDLVEDFSVETAIVVCELYKHNNEWKFNAVAAGYQGGLSALCKNYGLNV
ncbi:chemical-damaging agent resistance protein C [Synergistales bacterium]|nr:chemical-damaging agent resistance protein C [Synergistales bacterium]